MGRGVNAAQRHVRVQPPVAVFDVVLALTAFLGVLIATYPSAAQWLSAYQRSGEIVAYSQVLHNPSDGVLEDVLIQARSYNARMPSVLVSDPYSIADARTGAGGAWEAYQAALKVPGTDVMATVQIPAINVNLPVKHGTDDDVLATAAGHLFGSSLPVGGERSHAVITAHTAFTRAKLFDDLDELVIGDIFHIHAAGDTLTYEVESIDVVLPHEVELLQLEDGRDLVTLVTCTPAVVNSHRLLVRGTRIENPPQTEQSGKATYLDGSEPGFAWWALWVVGAGVGLTAYTLRRRGAH